MINLDFMKDVDNSQFKSSTGDITLFDLTSLIKDYDHEKNITFLNKIKEINYKL